MNRLIVWDLHGTLEQGNEVAVVKLSNEVLAYRGFRERFSESDAIRLYGLKWFEYFKFLLPNEEQHLWVALQDECFHLSELEFEIQRSCMSPTPWSHEVLAHLEKNSEQVLISNTRPRNLRLFKERLGLDRFFPEGRYFAVDGHSDHRATKLEVLEEYMEDRSFERIVVVGDSASDMALGAAVGAYRVLFRHPYFRKKQIDADLHISDLRDLMLI